MMKLDGKNKNKSKLHDLYNRTGSALFGGVGRGGGGWWGLIRRNEVFVTYEQVIRS